ncbi:MAG: hypothetical protein ACI9K2_006815, partial [Myxococcota bacterium]
DTALQIAVGVFAAPLTLGGVFGLFMPERLFGPLGLAPEGPVGMNSVRGLAGGFLFSSGLMMWLGLALGDTTWFLAVAVLMTVAVVGRVAGVALDGFDKDVVRPIVVEVLIAALLVAAHLRFGGMA